MHQPTFATVEYEQKKRKTRRERFLERIDALVPWEELAAGIASPLSHGPSLGGAAGPWRVARITIHDGDAIPLWPGQRPVMVATARLRRAGRA